MLDRLVRHRTVVIKRLGEGESGEKAFRRFLSNERVSEAALIAAAAAQVLSQVRGRRVLAIQDTSEINFSQQKRRKRALSDGGNGPAFFVHPVLVIDADSAAVVGVLDVALWEHHDKVTNRKKRPIEEKETHYWLGGIEAAARLRAAGAAAVTVIADREGDIYAAFARRPADVDVLVRAQNDRCLAGGGHLFAHLDGLPVMDRFVLDVPPVPGRPARTASMALRYGPVSLGRPRHGVHGDLPKSLDLFAIDVREIDPPKGVEPLHWRLTSSAPLDSREAAHRKIAEYRHRWKIEQLFRTIKSQGLELEESQIESPLVLRKLAIIALRAAVTCMQLVQSRDGADPRPASAAFDDHQIRVLDAIAPTVDGRTPRLSNPHDPQSLPWAAWIIARLGGWNGARNARPAGPVTIHRGLMRFQAIAEGFTLATNVSTR